MLDSSVLMDARKSPNDLHQIMKWVFANGGRLQVPAPAIAEMNRRNPFKVHASGFEPVAFGARAAESIGRELFSEAKLDTPNGQRTCMKFDLMILGCALTSKAEVLLTLDPALLKRAQRIGLEAMKPAEFLRAYVIEKQLNLGPVDK